MLFKDHFSGHAAAYARCRPGYPLELADWLASLAPARDAAWDCGCGSGQFSVLLGDRFERVYATDASARQLEHARPHERVEYMRAAAEASSLADTSVDLASAAQAAHWFDPEAYFREVRRVVRRGGVSAIFGYGLATVEPGDLDDRVGRFYGDTLAGHWPLERRHVESGYMTLPFPFEPIDAPPFESRAVWTAAEFVGYVHTWSAVRSLLSAGGEQAFEDFAGEVRSLWGEGKREVRWPLALRVGRVE